MKVEWKIFLKLVEKIIIESMEKIITTYTVTGEDGGFMKNKAACNFLQLLSNARLVTFRHRASPSFWIGLLKLIL